jgi:lipid-binding SYLF domain-containing protein/HEAT repeat protein
MPRNLTILCGICFNLDKKDAKGEQRGFDVNVNRKAITKYLIVVTAVMLFLATGSIAQDGTKPERPVQSDIAKRLDAASTVLNEIMGTPDKAIPDKILGDAECIAVVPSVIKIALGFGGSHGKGVATCRTAHGWSGPAPITITGGSWGLQFGGQATDIVMLVMNEKAMRHLLANKFKIGADASGAAGPVGRDAAAATDWKTKSELLTYSRSRGTFAGIDLKRTVVTQDKDETRILYEKLIPFESILTGMVPAPKVSRAFLATVDKYAPSQTQQAAVPASGQPASTPSGWKKKDQNAPTTTNESAQPPLPQPREGLPGQQASVAVSPKEAAWHTLEAACTANKAIDRANATRVLGLIPNDLKATKLAEKALSDPKPEVRVAAAEALGDMNSRKSIPKLKRVLDDSDPSVALAVAHSLRQMHNDNAYEVYSEVLSEKRKGGKGLISSEMSTFSDPKKMAQLGFEEGIGFVPFAGIGWSAIKEVRKDDSSPVRAAAAGVLADDPDPATTKVLEQAAGDKSWLVRAAALGALARRGDPSALHTVELYLLDEKDVVRYTAAASALRLIAHTKARKRQNISPEKRSREQ